jgi:hypothetical protein
VILIFARALPFGLGILAGVTATIVARQLREQMSSGRSRHTEMFGPPPTPAPSTARPSPKGGAIIMEAPFGPSTAELLEQVHKQAHDDANTIGIAVADYVKAHPNSADAAALAIAAAQARGELGRIIIDEVKNDPEVGAALARIQDVAGQLHTAAEPMRHATASFNALTGALGLISTLTGFFSGKKG